MLKLSVEVDVEARDGEIEVGRSDKRSHEDAADGVFML